MTYQNITVSSLCHVVFSSPLWLLAAAFVEAASEDGDHCCQFTSSWSLWNWWWWWWRRWRRWWWWIRWWWWRRWCLSWAEITDVNFGSPFCFWWQRPVLWNCINIPAVYWSWIQLNFSRLNLMMLQLQSCTMETPEQYNLSWKNFRECTTSTFRDLLSVQVFFYLPFSWTYLPPSLTPPLSVKTGQGAIEEVNWPLLFRSFPTLPWFVMMTNKCLLTR